MPASYPSSSKSFVTRVLGDTIAASHVNDLQLEVVAVESDLLSASPTFLATVTSGINAAALSTGTVSLSRLDANVLLTTSTTGINASAISTGTVPNARLGANVLLTTSTTGINASAISTGTVPNARLDANVLLTTSTTGINASALSTGTVPDGRISGAYTGVTSLAVGANVVANVTTVFVGNSTANVSHMATQISVANSTNTATLTPISLTIGTQVTNTVGFYAGANVYANATTVFVGNSTANVSHTATQLSVANSTNTATLTPISLTIGTQIANTIGFYAGANVYANTSTIFVGNSSVNSSHTATTIAVYANSTVNTIISAASANAITINGLTVGYLEVPQNSQSAAYGTVLADSGKHIFHPGSDNNARTFTIPANANVAYPTGAVLTFVNMANTVTIAITTDTMYLAGNGATGSRTLAANGIATALKMNSTAWLISGTGLT